MSFFLLLVSHKRSYGTLGSWGDKFGHQWEGRGFVLYFLQIRADGTTLHKIGVTRRTMAERLKEIERDLRGYYSHVSIEVLQC